MSEQPGQDATSDLQQSPNKGSFIPQNPDQQQEFFSSAFPKLKVKFM